MISLKFTYTPVMFLSITPTNIDLDDTFRSILTFMPFKFNEKVEMCPE